MKTGRALDTILDKGEQKVFVSLLDKSFVNFPYYITDEYSTTGKFV